MNVHPISQVIQPIDTFPALERILATFDAYYLMPDNYVNVKIDLINEYFRAHSLKAAVIGVSGGVDSALCLALIKSAASQPNSPIEKIHAVFLSGEFHEAATGQDVAWKRCWDLESALGEPIKYQSIINHVDELGTHIPNQNTWAAGQSIAHARTFALNGIASSLTGEGFPAVVIGTTNFDEGAYIGYVGKASDGAVDLQIISDLRKPDVYKFAKRLGVPSSIVDVTPTGDMYDGRSDTEVFGASYEFVRLYHYFLMMDDKSRRELVDYIIRQDSVSYDAMKQAFTNIENLHRYNAHKYIVGSPAIHLDIVPTGMNNGWRGNGQQMEQEHPQVMRIIFDNIPLQQHPLDTNWMVLDDLLSEQSIQHIEMMYNVSATGPTLQTDCHGMITTMATTVGSARRRVYDANSISTVLYQHIRHLLPKFVKVEQEWYRVSKLNDYIRELEYQPGTTLRPHYDGVPKVKEELGLFSVILYLTDNVSGATCRVRDREDVPKRKLPGTTQLDWDISASPRDIIDRCQPKRGRILVFPGSTVLHSSELLQNDEPSKKILLTEVLYKKIDVPTAKNVWSDLGWLDK